MTYRLWAKPEAIACAARHIEREWGPTGYSVTDVYGGSTYGSAVLAVVHADGSRFFVASDRWGNCVDADTLEDVNARLLEKEESNV